MQTMARKLLISQKAQLNSNSQKKRRLFQKYLETKGKIPSSHYSQNVKTTSTQEAFTFTFTFEAVLTIASFLCIK